MKAEYIDHMGNDDSIVNAARVSFSKDASQYTAEQNTKLIKYLATHKHEMPFAHTAITLRMKAPVPIRTQCFKSKVGFVENEESRRYIKSEPELFIPDEFRLKADNAKQGSGGRHNHSTQWMFAYKDHCNKAIQIYIDMILDDVCPEQARLILPQGVYVNWIWTGSLLAFARFYNLRTDPHAQKEIQDLAREVGDIMAQLYPIAWQALTNKDNAA